MSGSTRLRAASGALAALLVVAGCSSQKGPRPAPPPPPAAADERPFFLPPSTGYPLAAAGDQLAAIDDAAASLNGGVGLPEVEATARRVLAEDPSFHPATVLLAQVAYVRRGAFAAAELLQPVVDELPRYAAAALLLARALEDQGELPAALPLYRALGERRDLPRAALYGGRRADELRPRVLEILANRFEDGLGRGRLDAAAEALDELVALAPDEPATLDAERRLARELDDPVAELDVVERQLSAAPEDQDLRLRRAELEIATGNVRAGLAHLETLVSEMPDDREVAEMHERAKFLWRLQLLPADVQQTSQRRELDRADFASLLYWLAPQVRYAAVREPPIATDILDHPRRDEILRIAGLGLMEVDEVVHRFHPSEPVERRDALSGLLQLLLRSDRPLSCLSEAHALRLRSSSDQICRYAARCRLIAEKAECLAKGSLSGEEALDLVRRSLGLLATR